MLRAQITTAIGVGDCEAARVIGCVAHDMQYGWGITTYDCSGLSVVGGNVYNCTRGIFVEICTDVSLHSCTVGGTTPFNNSFYYSYAQNTLIGCTGNAGIASRGTINLRVTNCHSVGNQYGILLQNETSPARNQANTVVTRSAKDARRQEPCAQLAAHRHRSTPSCPRYRGRLRECSPAGTLGERSGE